jgi:hypothetical protein
MRFRSFPLRIERRRTPKTGILPESPIAKKALFGQFGWGFQGLPDATQSATTRLSFNGFPPRSAIIWRDG